MENTIKRLDNLKANKKWYCFNMKQICTLYLWSFNCIFLSAETYSTPYIYTQYGSRKSDYLEYNLRSCIER